MKWGEAGRCPLSPEERRSPAERIRHLCTDPIRAVRQVGALTCLVTTTGRVFHVWRGGPVREELAPGVASSTAELPR